jgi:hypothetical protein
MSGPGAAARHFSHFFVESDGSSYEISVQGGFIHIRGTSFRDYDQHGAGQSEQLKGMELTITYESVNGQAQTADIVIDTVDDEDEAYAAGGQRWEFSIPATWPACMLSPGQEHSAHNQLPALQAFFKQNVDNGMLLETKGVGTRNTLAREQTQSYTYSVCQSGGGVNEYAV